MSTAILIRNIVLLVICGWCSYTDIKRQEIDHTPLLLGVLFIIPFNILGFNDITIWQSLIGFAIIFVIFLLFAFFGMGGGDMKLMAMVGLFLGFSRGITMAIVGIYVAAIIGIVRMIISKNKISLKSKMPMAPSFTVGAIFIALNGYQIILDWIASNIVYIGA